MYVQYADHFIAEWNRRSERPDCISPHSKGWVYKKNEIHPNLNLKMARVPCVEFPAHSLLLFLRLGDYRLREIKCRKHNKARFVFHITLIFFRICHLNQLYFFYIHNHFIIQKIVSRRFHSNRIDQRLYLYGFETTQFWSDFNSKKKLAFNENCNMNRNGQRNQIEWSFTSLLPVLLLAAHCPLFLSINFLQIHSILNYYSVWMN